MISWQTPGAVNYGLPPVDSTGSLAAGTLEVNGARYPWLNSLLLKPVVGVYSMQPAGNDGLWLKDANLQPPVFDPLLTRGSQPRLWLKDRALGVTRSFRHRGSATKSSKGSGSGFFKDEMLPLFLSSINIQRITLSKGPQKGEKHNNPNQQAPWLSSLEMDELL
jgi:hypothetical protein